MTSWWHTFDAPFMQRALIEIVVAGALGGALGVHVSHRRLAFAATAMTHATFPGVVVAAILGWSALTGAALAGVLVVLAIALMSKRSVVDSTTSTAVILAGSFAIGSLLLTGRSGFNKDITAALTGSLLTISNADVQVTCIVAAIVFGLLIATNKELVFSAFDNGGAQALGYSTPAITIMVMVAVEATVVILMPSVGALLSVSMLVTPAATALLWASRTRTAIWIGSAYGATAGVVGLAVSVHANIAPGATVVLAQSALFVVTLATTRSVHHTRVQA